MSQSTRRQPIAQNLLEVQNFFKSRNHLDPMTGSGYKALVSEESNQDLLIGLAAKMINNDERMTRIFTGLAKRSVQGDTNAFVSAEGLDVAGVNANYDALPELNTYVILGYVARCDIMDQFHIVEGDQKTLHFKFDHSYMTKGTSGQKFSLPESIRDGTIANLTQLPEAIPLDTPDVPHLESLVIASGPGVGTSVWIKLGSAGNLLDESGYDSDKHNLQRNIKIALIRGQFGAGPTVFTAEIDVDRGYQTDNQTGVVTFNQYIEDLEYDSGTNAKVSFYVVGRIDLNSGKYTVQISGVSTPAVTFTHFKFGDARVTNIAKEMATLRPGNEQFDVTLDVEDKLTMAVPLTPETIDDFRTASGVDYVTAAVDIISEFYVGVRSVDMENAQEAAYSKNPARHRLAPKLGGWKDSMTFPLSARGPGGEDPYSWVDKGLKRSITNLLVNAHYDLRIPNSVPYEWICYGPEKDTQWLLGVDYVTQENGKGGESAVRYGFTFGSTYGYTDNYQRRMKVIGNQDKRMKDAGLRFNLKVDSMKAPFGVYYPLTFRVYKGKAAEFANLDSINVYQRDKIAFLASAQARVTLTGNDSSLYAAISAYSANHP